VTGKIRRGQRVGREKETDERDTQMRKGSATIRKGHAEQRSRPQEGSSRGSKYINTVLLKKEKSGNPR
jgi:hypothetical protein